LFFSFYDFSKSHKIRALRAIGLAPSARGMPQNAWSGKPCLRLGFLTTLVKSHFDSWRQRTE
jgi:hypothetical protein